MPAVVINVVSVIENGSHLLNVYYLHGMRFEHNFLVLPVAYENSLSFSISTAAKTVALRMIRAPPGRCWRIPLEQLREQPIYREARPYVLQIFIRIIFNIPVPPSSVQCQKV